MADGDYKSCEVDLEFADGLYRFKLGLKQLVELEEKCQSGLGEIFARLLTGWVMLGKQELGLSQRATYRINDIRETIRLGLIGGGGGTVSGEPVRMDPTLAMKIVERYVDDRPKEEAWRYAVAILTVCCQGFDKKRFDSLLPGNEEAEPGEAAVGKPEAAEPEAAASTIRSSSGTAARSGLGRKKPGGSRSGNTTRSLTTRKKGKGRRKT